MVRKEVIEDRSLALFSKQPIAPIARSTFPGTRSGTTVSLKFAGALALIAPFCSWARHAFPRSGLRV
jgi:hypothetical protein